MGTFFLKSELFGTRVPGFVALTNRKASLPPLGYDGSIAYPWCSPLRPQARAIECPTRGHQRDEWGTPFISKIRGAAGIVRNKFARIPPEKKRTLSFGTRSGRPRTAQLDTSKSSIGAPRFDRKRVRSSAPLVALRGAPKGRVGHSEQTKFV